MIRYPVPPFATASSPCTTKAAVATPAPTRAKAIVTKMCAHNRTPEYVPNEDAAFLPNLHAPSLDLGQCPFTIGKSWLGHGHATIISI